MLLGKRSVLIKYEVTIKSIGNVSSSTGAVRVGWQTNKASGKTKALSKQSGTQPVVCANQADLNGVIEFKKDVIKWENIAFVEDNTLGACNFVLTVHEKVGSKYQPKGKTTINLNEFVKTDGWQSNFVSKEFTVPATSSMTTSSKGSSPGTGRSQIIKDDEQESRGRSRRSSTSREIGDVLKRSTSRSASRKRSDSTSGSSAASSIKSLGVAGGIAIGGIVGGVTGAVIGGIVSSSEMHFRKDKDAIDEAEFLKLSQQQLIEEMKKKEQLHFDLLQEHNKLKQDQLSLQNDKDSLKREVDELRRKLDSLESQSRLSGDRLQQQQTQRVTQLEQQLDQQKLESQRRQQQLEQDVQKIKQDSQKRQQELEQQLQKQTEEANRLQQQLRLQQQEVQRQQQELKALLDSQGKGNDDFMRIQRQKETDFKNQISQLTSENNGLKMKETRLNTEVTGLKAQIARLNSETADLKRNVTAQARLNDVEREKVSLETKVNQLQRSLQLATEQNKDYEKEKTRLKQINMTQIYELARVKDHEKELEALVATLQKTKIEGEEGKKRDVEKDAQRDSQIEALKRERDGYLKQLTEGDKNLSAQIQSYISQIKELQEKANQAKQGASEELTEAKIKIQKLERDLEKKTMALQILEKQSQEEIEKLQKKKEKLKRLLEKLEGELSEVQHQYMMALKDSRASKSNPNTPNTPNKSRSGNKKEEVLAGLSFSNYSEGTVEKVDSRSQLVLTELLSTADRLDRDSIDTFVYDLRTLVQKARKKQEMAFWIKQVSFIVDSFLEAFPTSHLIPGYKISIYGIKVVGSSDDEHTMASPKSKFVHDLIEFLFWALQKFCDTLFDDVSDILIDCMFPDREKKFRSDESDSESGEESDGEVDISEVLGVLEEGLKCLRDWKVENAIVLQAYAAVTQLNDVALFNHLLKNTEKFCTYESAAHIKDILSSLDKWKVTQFSGFCDEFSLKNLGIHDYMTETHKLMVGYKKLPKDKEGILSNFPHLTLPHISFIITGMQEENAPDKQTKVMLLGLMVGWGVIDPKLRDLLVSTKE